MARLPRILRVWPWLAAITSGLLYAGCFAPFNQAWLCWIALTPLLAAVWFSGAHSKRRWLRDALLGYVSGLVFFTVVFSWLGTLGTLFESFPLHGLAALLSLYLAVYPALWAWLAGRLTPRPSAAVVRPRQPSEESPDSPWLKSSTNLRIAFCLASVWVTFEWIRGWLFGGFGWNGLGVALHANWPIIQIAEYTGVGGLSFVIAFANVIAISSVHRLILEARTHRMRPHYDLTLTMAAIVGLLAFGFHAFQSRRQTTRVRVAAIQPNISQRERFDMQSNAEIFARFTKLSEIALQTKPLPDLMAWPESSMPDPARDERSESHRFIVDLLSGSSTTDLLLGTTDLDDQGVYNAALFVPASSEAMQIYRKIHLVPFGEYVPLRSFPPFGAIAGKWVPSDFEFGRDHTVFRLTRSNVLIAPLICFEDTVGDLARQFVLKGANLFVDITNDAWFLHSVGSSQHVANALFRCVETRRPMVRAANTGVTCIINEFGRVTETLRDDTGSTFTEGVLTSDVDVPIGGEPTFYSRHGEIFTKACAGISVLVLLALVPRLFRRRRSTAQA